MSLSDDIAAFKPKGCATCNWYRQLPERDREAFDTWVDNYRNAPRSYPLINLQNLCAASGLVTHKRCFRDHVQLHHEARP